MVCLPARLMDHSEGCDSLLRRCSEKVGIVDRGATRVVLMITLSGGEEP